MGTNRTNGSLYTNIQNRVAWVEFGHPASNSFVSELLERLAQELHKLSSNTEVSIIVLKSEGEKAFCAGASFTELVAISNLEEGKAFFSGFAQVINAMRQCNKPILGRIQGKAVGGGVGLAAACDYVYAVEDAAVKLSELSIHIGPFVIEPALDRKLGKAAFAEMALAPTEWKNAYWCQQKGLYNKVFSGISEMDKELELHAEQLASYGLEALQEMKKVLWEGTENWDTLLSERAEISGRLALMPQAKAVLEQYKK